MTDTQAPLEPAHMLAAQSTWGSDRFAVAYTAATSIEKVFAGSTSWIALPLHQHPAAAPPSRLTLLLRESRSLTGWSQRDLAAILGTSHTTVRRLETDGRVSPRTRDVAARAAQLHGVLARLAGLTSGPDHLTMVLATPGTGGTPGDLLRAGDWSQAYLVALDALRPPAQGMLGASPTRMLPATRELRP